ncbi:zinc carboxypeptidase, putative [Trypanosoma equiperdum]|uniref:Zinc carboxypeptidase, putative n=2 Tax=Trypanozoon TaxID=39700 RepID=Q383Q1_TRYB2|nr:zinc carboxypeptidase, putative [Trypanosoma brucei brucei TREU927]EAN79980.1 zinc carboxypeptidase, putative [Trypanosoma brucei brucei TREU927]SCU72775.1 zinc carboxypeptidase, putative [Trypanosoma equiperdum]
MTSRIEKSVRGKGAVKLRGFLKSKEQLFATKLSSPRVECRAGNEEKGAMGEKDVTGGRHVHGVVAPHRTLDTGTASVPLPANLPPDGKGKKLLNPLRKKLLRDLSADEGGSLQHLPAKPTGHKELGAIRIATADVFPAGEAPHRPAALSSAVLSSPMQGLKTAAGKLNPPVGIGRKKRQQKLQKAQLASTVRVERLRSDGTSRCGKKGSVKVPSECSSLNSSITCTVNTNDCAELDRESGVDDIDDPNDDNAQELSANELGDELAPYDEVDEEEAVQRYMGSHRASTSPKKTEDSVSLNRCLSDPSLSNTLCDARAAPLDRPNSAIGSCAAPEDLQRSLDEKMEESSRRPSTAGQLGEGTSSFGTQKASELFNDSLCRSLSLYDAFFLNEDGTTWLVDDRVLARCLNYIGLMDYEHELHGLRRTTGNNLSASAWAQLSSPVKRNVMPSSVASAAPPLRCTTSPNFVNSSNSFSVGQSKLCKAPESRGGRPDFPTLFLDIDETMRWLSGQEYVIGTILACCTRDSDASEDGNVQPYLSPAVHPIKQIATIVRECYPHWGSTVRFADAWEKQVVLVLGTSSPSHQLLFPFPEEGIFFSSDMEGGNIARVERMPESTLLHLQQYPQQPNGIGFSLWMEPEPGCGQRLWFRFAFAGVKPHTSVTLRLVNIQPTTKLYGRNGMRPVWRAGNCLRQWVPVAQCSYRTTNDEADGELTFVITPRTNDVIHVAFCVPYTYADLLCHITHWHNLVKNSTCDIWFEERVLCYTQDGRKLHMLIITSSSTKTNQRHRSKRKVEGSNSANNGACGPTACNANSNGGGGNPSRKPIVGPYSQFEKGKKVVLVSGRVHPGETTASHGVHGAISFLLSRDPLAAKLRDNFIFYIVPMLNPDGVSRGHTRLDQNGFNLNRCYNRPIPQTQPTVSALRKVFDHLRQVFDDRFFMYLDFHSHVSQSSCFAFGNCLPATVQHWNMLFPKIISLHAKELFGYSICRFGRGHMLSKEGSSRVLFGAGLIHSYTIELTYFTNNRLYIDGLLAGGTSNIMDGESWEDRYTHTQIVPQRSPVAHNASTVTPLNEQGTAVGAVKSSKCVRSNSQQKRLKKRDVTKIPSDCGNGKPELLRQIRVPCILAQSAEVGRSCMLSLLDYCSVDNYISPQFAAYGGMERMLRDVKRHMGSPTAAKPGSCRLQFIYKQQQQLQQ